jgi:archaemetzincin
MSVEVHIWWIGADAPDDGLLEAVRRGVESVFGVRAKVERHADRPTHAFDARRGQHSSSQILKWLVGRAPSGRVLAVTDVDLFIPVLTFVYGEAQLGGDAAVVSTARLAAGPGTMGDEALFGARVVKECIHELGHTFGLIHCDSADCVMARSVNLLEVDAKRTKLCGDCGTRFGAAHHKEQHHE